MSNADTNTQTPRRDAIEKLIGAAMQTVWDDFGGDTGCVPSCIEIRGPSTTRIVGNFEGSKFSHDVTQQLCLELWGSPDVPQSTGDLFLHLDEIEASDSVRIASLGLFSGLLERELAAAKAENEELRLYKSEHERLKAELNHILNPNGDGPLSPSFCDLIGFVHADLTAARKDSERLDWLESHPKVEISLMAMSGTIEVKGYDDQGDDFEAREYGLRAAIDAATEGGER